MTTTLDIKAKFVSQKEAARRLGLSAPTVKNLLDSGAIRSVTLGTSRRYIPRTDLERFMREVAG